MQACAHDTVLSIIPGGMQTSDCLWAMLCAALVRVGSFQSCWGVYVVAMRRGVPLRYTTYLAVMTAAIKVTTEGRAALEAHVML